MLRAPVPRGRKVAVAAVPVRKYHQVIGFATTDIARATTCTPTTSSSAPSTGLPLRRGRDRDGVRPGRAARRSRASCGPTGGSRRNYIGILTSVNCSATTAKIIAGSVRSSDLLARFPDVDGVVALTHSQGCGMASSGEGFDTL